MYIYIIQEAVSNVLDNALKYVLVRGSNAAQPSVSMFLRPCHRPIRGVEVVILVYVFVGICICRYMYL